jgi:hypothetical protein
LWNANLSSTAVISKNPATGVDQITITGTDVVNTVTIIVPAKVGVYDLKTLTSGSVLLTVVPTSNFASNACISNPEGTVEITSLDLTAKTVSGKFSARLCPVTAVSAPKMLSEGTINSVKITG